MATYDEDLAAWYRADRESAQATYGAAESGTLVGLLPVLDAEIEMARNALSAWKRGQEDGMDADTMLQRRTGEVMSAIEARAHADPAWVGMVEEVGAGLRAAVDDLRARSGGQTDRLIDIAFVQSLALTQRRHLLREELKARGLLPQLP